MKSESIEQDFASAKSDFARLESAQLLPPNMLIKLKFLQATIAKQTVSEDIIEMLPHYQRQSLEEMPTETQIQLFISIVKCLSGREVIVYFRNERAYLKKEKSFFGWAKCYVNCDSKCVSLIKSKSSKQTIHKFQVQHLWISRNYKNYKKKTIFAIYYENIKYVLGFDEEITCRRIHEVLSELVKEKREYNYTKYNLEKDQKPGRMGMDSKHIINTINDEELGYLANIERKISNYDLTDDREFKLNKNLQQGRLLQRPNNGSIKINLIIENVKIAAIIESYLAMKQWNHNIETFTLVSKPRTNSYIYFLKTHKYSFLSYPRDCFVSVVYYTPCPCRSSKNLNSSYLLIESIDSQEGLTAGLVRMAFKQVIEFSTNKKNQSIILMTILTEADFKGYSSTTDNLNMTMHLQADIDQFVKLAKRQDQATLFENIPCPCKIMPKARKYSDMLSDISLPTEQNQMSIDLEEDNQSNFSYSTKNETKNSNRSEDVIIALSDVLNSRKNQSIVDILKTKSYYSYILKHKFGEGDDFIKNFHGDNKSFLLQGKRWSFKQDQYQFMDEEVLAAQKDILKMIIKQLGTNLMSGKSFMNMSLPVEIFDRKSMLDVVAESFGFVPHFMAKAAQETNPLEQIKYVSCAFMFLSATGPNIEKPFNPILGETYQGVIGNMQISLEQISHHPPIASIFIKTKDFEISGNFDIVVDMGLNSAYSKVSNWLQAKIFKTKTEYFVKIPDVELGGLAYGVRTLKITNKCFVYEKNSHLFCEISVGKDKKRVYEQKVKPADLIGGIFRVKPEFGQKVEITINDRKKNFDGVKPDNIVESCCFLSGKWYGIMYFGDKCYKSLTDGPFPEKSYKLQYLLPSDSIFREDVIFRIWNDNDRSNAEKERLENIQRGDRKLRQKFNKHSLSK